MINPNICKYVLVDVASDSKTATYRGVVLEVNELRGGFPKPGRRRMYLKYSIMSNCYYLTRKY